MPRPDTLAIHAPERLLAWALVLVCVALLFAQAPHGGAFYWSDSPRHALNGVFVMDMIKAMPIDDPTGYAYRYYAQYPALTILFYPPLFYAISAPFYAVLGVSHETALLVVAIHYLALGLGCWRLARYWLPAAPSLAFAVLVLWLPEVAFWGRQVMLEVPAFAFLVWSAVAVMAYLRGGPPRWLYLGAALLVLGMYTKISVAYMAVVYAALIAQRDGWEVLRNRHHWWVAGLSVVGLLPLAVLTLKFGQANLQSVTGVADAVASRASWQGWVWYLQQIPAQAGWPLTLLGLAGAIMAAWRRIPGLGFWWLGFAVGYLFFSSIDLKEARHSVFLLPSVVFFAVLCVHTVVPPRLGRWAHAALAMLVLATVGLTVWTRPVFYVQGYAQAAAEVARLAPRDSTVMFSGYRDGSFVFSMRAREDRRDLQVMRADKLLLGVAVRRELGVEQKGLTEAEIAEAINANGVHYVVMQPGFWIDLEAMQRFERVMASDQFEAVARIATPANHNAHETELVIYRNKGAVSPRRQSGDIELRIINRSISAQ
ncbi:4-amino-4-deoxy-L-arabinose transferase [Acidovorax carolinensis]|uniref:4-amino-4-deoxy-L-arabinose transferase n=1 Tax=Acidovorax carolinensis TaxID=553814 RepID=A0A240UFU3_9BURK|nr:glycosyltransferase family 39 protein [Acidovorax carolinensis]ART54012.1 4-amino-4-deoxy-L-arabinose transferase [Acidovorax carolinensis]ART60371.1 4-amino-4-deoxy-L-arabinose transferase [Acidovorax carolinensis]